MMFVFRRVLFASLLLFTSIALAESALDEVVVSGTRLREQVEVEVPASLTVLSRDDLHDSAEQHFEEIMSQAPNLNWAAGSSRPRYFQIRGIGEREQYEGAPNSSVGLLIDDIDFSGVGMAATLFDVSQIEILRGPQSARLGANALAGLIAIRSADPEETYASSAMAQVGNYGTRSIGVSATAPVDKLDSAWRFSAQKFVSDGFRTDAYLHRDDTNNRDESTLRGKWRWNAGDRARLDLTLMHVDLANGYDAFSIDNSRTTLSDKPGEDSQRVTAGAAKWTQSFDSGNTFTAIATATNSTSVHAYDGDWGNPRDWLPYTYDFIYRAVREHKTQTLEARLASAESNRIYWLVGVYALKLQERIGEVSGGLLIDPDPVFGYTFAVDDYLNSRYDAKTLAAFGQLDGKLSDRWSWTAGLRGESRDADYSDAGSWGEDPNRRTVADKSDDMIGANISTRYAFAEAANVYATIARGYKAGGFNFGSARARAPTFKPETLWNYEVGTKGRMLDGRLETDAAVFYMERKNMQVRSGAQLVAGDPNSFVFFTGNAASGENYGFEGSLRWSVSNRLELGASLGLLNTSASGLLDADGNELPRREQAHAPNYQAQVNATWRSGNWMTRLDYFRNDAFYFDTDHNQKAKAYSLVNAKVGFEREHWRAYVWSRNLFDEDYSQRGFFFGNEPPNFEDKLYLQSGDPRTVGLSLEWQSR